MPKTFDPRSFHPDAVVVLELIQGETSPKLSEILSNYGYQQDGQDRSLWRYGNSGRGGLLFDRDNTVVAIVGTDEENIDNSNYILTTAGWNNVTIHSADIKAEERVIECLTTLMVDHMERYWDQGAIDGADTEIDRAPEPEMALEPIGVSVGSALAQAASLSQTAAPVASYSVPAELASEAPSLPVTAASSAHITPALRTAPAGKHDALLRVIEEYVLKTLVPAPSDPVIQALKDAGYEVKFVLQPI